MIDHAPIRNAIVGGLTQHLERPVVMLDQGAPKPAYPFVIYRFTSGLIEEPGLPAETGDAVSSEDPTWRHDYQYTQRSQPTAVLSLIAISRDPDEAYQLALDALAWFRFHGYDALKAAGVVVVRAASGIQNRDTLIVDDYERRQGFDLVLRMSSELVRRVSTIESVETQRAGGVSS